MKLAQSRLSPVFDDKGWHAGEGLVVGRENGSRAKRIGGVATSRTDADQYLRLAAVCFNKIRTFAAVRGCQAEMADP